MPIKSDFGMYFLKKNHIKSDFRTFFFKNFDKITFLDIFLPKNCEKVKNWKKVFLTSKKCGWGSLRASEFWKFRQNLIFSDYFNRFCQKPSGPQKLVPQGLVPNCLSGWSRQKGKKSPPMFKYRLIYLTNWEAKNLCILSWKKIRPRGKTSFSKSIFCMLNIS